MTRDRAHRLLVEALEDRLALSTLDLTSSGAEGMINDAIFRQTDAQPTGTGVIRSFVRVQDGGIEQGYNTEARPLEFDENSSPQFTRALRLLDVPTVDIDGMAYRQFLLDINQNSANPYLSLDELRIFLAGSPSLTGYDSSTHQLAGHTAVYDLDASEDSWIKLNYRLNAGSGAGDMFVYIPNSAFADAGPDSYVYLFSRFGDQFGGNAGFEEWAVRVLGDSPQGPPGAFSSLSGFVYHDLNQNGLRDADEPGIAGVILQLQGTNDLGQTVVLVVTTGSNGFYSFTGLRAGTYSILETQPEGWMDGAESIGTQGGNVENDRLFDILLAGGVDGFDNNFAEFLAGS